MDPVPPDPSWSDLYENAATPLRSSLQGLGAEVHHIGSTAIRGIWAKPIIDILVVVPSLAALDAGADRICALGYEAKGEYGIPGRRYFRKESEAVRSHHVHAFEAGSIGATRHLAFRDYMNAHPDAAKSYSKLKQQLARECAGNAQAYVQGKDAFVTLHELLALEWAASKER